MTPQSQFWWHKIVPCFKHNMPEIFVSLPLDIMRQEGLGTPPIRGHITRSCSTKYRGLPWFQGFAIQPVNQGKLQLYSDNFAICMTDTFCSIEMY